MMLGLAPEFGRKIDPGGSLPFRRDHIKAAVARLVFDEEIRVQGEVGKSDGFFRATVRETGIAGRFRAAARRRRDPHQVAIGFEEVINPEGVTDRVDR